MLTWIHDPTKYNFSRNRCYVEVETDNATYTENQGNKAICYFTGIGAAIINDTLQIKSGAGGTTFTYTFKAATNILANEIKVISGGQSESDYVAELANILNTDAALTAVVNVTAYYTSLFFEAVLPGAAYNFVSPTGTSFAITGFLNTPGTDDNVTLYRPNYKIVLTLYKGSGSSWEQIVEISKEPINNRILCDLSEYLDKSLSYDLPPFYDGWPARKCENVSGQFYVKIEEHYGNPPVAVATTVSPGGVMQNATDTNVFTVLKAGFDELSARLQPDFQFSYYSLHSAFLTRQNRVKKITANQIEYLFFLFFSTPTTTARIRYAIYYKDGSILTGTHLATTSGVQFGEVWTFPVHRVQGFFSVTGPYKMEVALQDTSSLTDMSETFTYLLDETVYLDETFFYFTNSDGGVDTLRCCGVREVFADFEFEEADRTLTVDDTRFDGDSETLYRQKENGGTVHSGWKTRDELAYIEELFMSKKVFMFGNDYGQLIPIPVKIVSRKLVKNRTKQHLYGYVIEWKERFRQEISQAQYYPIA